MHKCLFISTCKFFQLKLLPGVVPLGRTLDPPPALVHHYVWEAPPQRMRDQSIPAHVHRTDAGVSICVQHAVSQLIEARGGRIQGRIQVVQDPGDDPGLIQEQIQVG